jgi:hypothetical protein
LDLHFASVLPMGGPFSEERMIAALSRMFFDFELMLVGLVRGWSSGRLMNGQS